MKHSSLQISHLLDTISLKFVGEFTLYNIAQYEKQVYKLDKSGVKKIILDFNDLTFMDSAAAIFIYKFEKSLFNENVSVEIHCIDSDILQILSLVKEREKDVKHIEDRKRRTFLEKIGEHSHRNYLEFMAIMSFMGELFTHKIHYLLSPSNIRFKEIAFEINESGLKAFNIVALTSFLIGLVVAYQSAYQLKIYGANIFIVDMMGLSVLRELSPVITAIVIAGRSGSAFTAQIGAMKITEEIDAMRTMGFDPYKFLVLPRIIALMIVLPILIFVSDVMAIIGGMLVANIDLGISTHLFLERFNEVIAAKHFFIGIFKGPFFAFLIATIGIYRGLMVKNDTQSIGFNTTKSVVESIFAVIICDAIFSIAFTNLGI